MGGAGPRPALHMPCPWNARSAVRDGNMSEKPRVDVLMLKLNDLVEWEPFALQLGMSPAEIQIIVVNNNGVQAQKQALFTNWLRKYPSASMGQVVQALTLVGENAIAFNLVEQEVPNVDASGGTKRS